MATNEQRPVNRAIVENGREAVSNRVIAWQAVLAILPLSIAVIPWGLLTGALAIEVGMSAVQAQLMSLLVFAGAAQLSATSLLAAGASPFALYGSTFVISSRHLLYSISFRDHVLALPLHSRLAIAMVLTDEMFAVSQSHTAKHGVFSPLFALVSGVTFYLIWNLATLLGIIAGESFQNLSVLGLDFAIAATFIAMTFDQVRRFPIAVCILVSGILAVILKPYLPDSYIIIAALCGMTAGYLVDVGGDNHD